MSYFYKIENGPNCSIVPAGNGMWSMFMDEKHIITSGSPQSCVHMVSEMKADMGDCDAWRKAIPYHLNDWEEKNS